MNYEYNGIQKVKLKFRLYVSLYNKDNNYMVIFTFQTYNCSHATQCNYQHQSKYLHPEIKYRP